MKPKWWWGLALVMLLGVVMVLLIGTESASALQGEDTPTAYRDAFQLEPESRFTTSGLSGDSLFSAPSVETGNLFITHSSTQNVVAGNSASCNNQMYHRLNSYYRVFNLPSMGINDAIEVDEISFGVEQAVGNGGTQPVVVRLHKLDGAFILTNLTQLGSESISLPDSATGTIYSVAFDPEIIVAAGTTLVAEVFTPDGVATMNRFFIGSNPDPETAISYIRAPACNITQPASTASIGFPNMHTVINLSAGLILPTPTNTPAPPTATSIPPTATSIPPSATPVPPSATPAPGTPTATSIPPSATPVLPTPTPTVAINPSATPQSYNQYLPLARRR